MTYNLSAYLACIPTVSFEDKTTYNISDSFEFARTVPRQPITTLYVVSPCTDTTLQLTLDIMHDKWFSVSNNTSLDPEEFLNIMKFRFDSTVYHMQRSLL